MKVFPSPWVLDPDRSKLTPTQQKHGWKIFLDFNEKICDFNLANVHNKTLNVTSYIRAPIKLDNKGRRKGLKKYCLELSTREDHG